MAGAGRTWMVGKAMCSVCRLVCAQRSTNGAPAVVARHNRMSYTVQKTAIWVRCEGSGKPGIEIGS